MNLSRRGLIVVVLTIGSVGAGVAAASGALNSDTGQAAKALGALQSGAISHDRHAVARSYGVDADTARPVLTDSSGKVISLARSAQGTCLVQWYGDTCRTSSQIAAGEGLSVIADCSTSKGAGRKMVISGLVPPSTAEVRVGYSDGDQQTAKTVDGAYLIEGATPERGGAHPTTFDWVDPTGRTSRSAPFPYDDVCVAPPAG